MLSISYFAVPANKTVLGAGAGHQRFKSLEELIEWMNASDCVILIHAITVDKLSRAE